MKERCRRIVQSTEDFVHDSLTSVSRDEVDTTRSAKPSGHARKACEFESSVPNAEHAPRDSVMLSYRVVPVPEQGNRA